MISIVHPLVSVFCCPHCLIDLANGEKIRGDSGAGELIGKALMRKPEVVFSAQSR